MSMTTADTNRLPADAGERIDPRRLLAFLAMCFGMFMAFLDIRSVSATALAEIQAGLAASAHDEISWVQTSHLIAEVVAIPLSGLSLPGARNALHVRGLRRRLHHLEPDVRDYLLDE